MFLINKSPIDSLGEPTDAKHVPPQIHKKLPLHCIVQIYAEINETALFLDYNGEVYTEENKLLTPEKIVQISCTTLLGKSG